MLGINLGGMVPSSSPFVISQGCSGLILVEEQLSSVLDVARHPTKCWMSTGTLSSTVGISGAEGHGLPPHRCSHQTPLGEDHRIWPLPVIPKSCIYWDQGTGLRSPLHSHREEAWGRGGTPSLYRMPWDDGKPQMPPLPYRSAQRQMQISLQGKTPINDIRSSRSQLAQQRP